MTIDVSAPTADCRARDDASHARAYRRRDDDDVVVVGLPRRRRTPVRDLGAHHRAHRSFGKVCFVRRVRRARYARALPNEAARDRRRETGESADLEHKRRQLRGNACETGQRLQGETVRKDNLGTLIDGQPILEEHYKSLPLIEFNGESWYWRNSVLKNMERTKERQRQLEEEKKKKERKALQMKRKRKRDKLQSVRDAKRDKRR